MTERSIEATAKLAVQGDRDSLDALVRALQPDVYGLALRMLWNREDAEDATQEILVRAVTRLSQFDFRSSMRTWVYRVAVNYLLDVKKSPVERMRLTFQVFGDDLLNGLSDDGPAEAERSPSPRKCASDARSGCSSAWIARIGWPTSSARSSSCRGRMPPRRWTSRRRCFENGCRRRVQRLNRSHMRPAGWRRTTRLVPAIVACQPR